MNAGERRHRPDVEQLVVSEDGFGGHADSWAPLGKVWANIEPLSGREQTEAMRQETAASHRVTVLKAAGLPAEHLRFIHHGRALRQVGPSLEVGGLGVDVEYQCEDVGPPPETAEASS